MGISNGIFTMILILAAVCWLIGVTGGSALAHDNPNMNITNYTQNLTETFMANSLKNYTVNETNHLSVVTKSFATFIYTAGFQSSAAGYEFGFTHSWIPPEVTAIITLILILTMTSIDGFVVFAFSIFIFLRDVIGGLIHPPTRRKPR